MKVFKFSIDFFSLKYLKHFFILYKKVLILLLIYIIFIFYSPTYFEISDLNNISKNQKNTTGRIYKVTGKVIFENNRLVLIPSEKKKNFEYELVLQDHNKKEMANLITKIIDSNSFLVRFYYNDFEFINQKKFKLDLIKIQ